MINYKEDTLGRKQNCFKKMSRKKLGEIFGGRKGEGKGDQN